MRDGRGGRWFDRLARQCVATSRCWETRKPEDGGTIPGKRCDDDTTGAERNGALGDGDGLATDEGQPGGGDGSARPKTSREGQAAGEEDSSAPSWQSVS